MPDNPKDRGPEDGQRINIHQEHEVKYWCKAFDCTPEELRSTVERVGVMAESVRRSIVLSRFIGNKGK